MMSNLASGLTLGRYRLTHLLRDGDTRQVFGAEHLSESSQRTVIKIAALDNLPDAARLKREYDVLVETSASSVVAAMEYGESPQHGVSYLVLKDQGPSLAAVLAQTPGKGLPTEAALAAAHAMAVALESLHAQGWIHGDLKPGNVLCNPDGSVVLSDLEFASRISNSTAAADFTLGGTPPFVAPELWRNGAAALSPAADVWALGVTLYLALFAEYPFGDSGNEAVLAAIDRGLPPCLQQAPRPLAILLTSLLKIDPRARPNRGAAAAAAIEHIAPLMRIDPASARSAFARLVAAVPDRTPPPEPGTVVAPSVAPDAGALTPRAAIPAPAPPSPTVPTRRPEGVGAAATESRAFRLSQGWQSKPSSTSSVRLENVLDISSRADILPAAPQPAPSAAPSGVPSDSGTLTRRAAARWYRRMNPQRNFPLSVVFSGKQIRIVGGAGLGITLGQREIVVDPAHPVLAVEPWFPGCLISPPRADVVVSQETTVCRFWITPLVCGDLNEACIAIRYRDNVVETLATPAKVVTRTTAKLLAGFGLAFPLVSKGMKLAGWDLDTLLQDSFPYAAYWVNSLGLMRTGLLVTALLLAGAAGYFYITRPLMSEEAEPALLPQAS